jgi:hypothetical protein
MILDILACAFGMQASQRRECPRKNDRAGRLARDPDMSTLPSGRFDTTKTQSGHAARVVLIAWLEAAAELDASPPERLIALGCRVGAAYPNIIQLAFDSQILPGPRGGRGVSPLSRSENFWDGAGLASTTERQGRRNALEAHADSSGSNQRLSATSLPGPGSFACEQRTTLRLSKARAGVENEPIP